MGADLTKNVKKAGNTPAKDADLGNLGLNVANHWKTNPQLTLLWITSAQHETNVTSYNASLLERNSTGGGRGEISKKLSALDREIDLGISAIKGYLVYKYEKNQAPSYYPQFGIAYKGKTFLLPRDRNKRNDALPLIVAAIAKHGFGNEKYGSDFWQQLTVSYQALLEKAVNIDGTVSVKVSVKNELRKTLVETHNALVHVLKANYPRTWKAVLREWGFQKEKY